MEPLSIAKNVLRVATSQTLATVARLDGSAHRHADAALTWAGVPTRAEVDRLTARMAALQAAVDRLR